MQELKRFSKSKWLPGDVVVILFFLVILVKETNTVDEEGLQESLLLPLHNGSDAVSTCRYRESSSVSSSLTSLYFH